MPIISAPTPSPLGAVTVTGTPAATNVLTATSTTAADWEAITGAKVGSGAATSTQVLKADGAGGAGFANSGYALIASGRLSGAAASLFDVSGISGAFLALLIQFTARGTNASATINLRFRVNNDSGTNYDVVDWFVNGAGPTTGGGTSTAQAQAMGNIACAAASAAAGEAGSFSIFLPQYAGTDFFKYGFVSGSSLNGAGTYTWYAQTLKWKSAGTAINRVALTASAGSYDIGSAYAIWGAA